MCQGFAAASGRHPSSLDVLVSCKGKRQKGKRQMGLRVVLIGRLCELATASRNQVIKALQDCGGDETLAAMRLLDDNDDDVCILSAATPSNSGTACSSKDSLIIDHT